MQEYNFILSRQGLFTVKNSYHPLSKMLSMLLLIMYMCKNKLLFLFVIYKTKMKHQKALAVEAKFIVKIYYKLYL